MGDSTLRRFFVIHYILPFVMLALGIIHLFYIHKKNTTDINNNSNLNNKLMINLYPSFIIKDIFSFLFVFIITIIIVCFFPNVFANPVNEINADPLVTPEHILPEWYFLSFYAILKFIPSKIIGIIFMFSFIIIPLFLSFFTIKNYEIIIKKVVYLTTGTIKKINNKNIFLNQPLFWYRNL